MLELITVGVVSALAGAAVGIAAHAWQERRVQQEASDRIAAALRARQAEAYAKRVATRRAKRAAREGSSAGAPSDAA